MNKKYILGFILGVIISGSIVYAGTMIARDIDYDNTSSQLKDANNQDVDNVQDAIDALYNKIGCNEWTQVNDAFMQDTSYITGGSLYKCNNLCKINFTLDGTVLNTDYKVLNNSKYYPKNNITVYAFGHNYYTAEIQIKTDGNVNKIHQYSQNGQNINGGWLTIKNIIYMCDN